MKFITVRNVRSLCFPYSDCFTSDMSSRIKADEAVIKLIEPKVKCPSLTIGDLSTFDLDKRVKVIVKKTLVTEYYQTSFNPILQGSSKSLQYFHASLLSQQLRNLTLECKYKDNKNDEKNVIFMIETMKYRFIMSK